MFQKGIVDNGEHLYLYSAPTTMKINRIKILIIKEKSANIAFFWTSLVIENIP